MVISHVDQGNFTTFPIFWFELVRVVWRVRIAPVISQHVERKLAEPFNGEFVGFVFHCLLLYYY